MAVSAAAICLAACALWALRPLPLVAPLIPLLASAEPTVAPAHLDVSKPTYANATLWNPPPPHPPPPQETPAKRSEPPVPAKPLKLQLLAILREIDAAGAEQLKAALYDPDADTIHFVAPGELVGGRKIARIDARSVELSDGASIRRLELDTAGAAVPVNLLSVLAPEISETPTKRGER